MKDDVLEGRAASPDITELRKKVDELINQMNRIVPMVIALDRNITQLNDSFNTFANATSGLLDILAADKLLEGCEDDQCKF